MAQVGKNRFIPLLLRVPNRALIGLKGEKAAQFLQGLTTQDMRVFEQNVSISPYISSLTTQDSTSININGFRTIKSRPSLFLNSKGKMLADCIIYDITSTPLQTGNSTMSNSESQFLIECSTSISGYVHKLLMLRRLTAPVKIWDASLTWQIFQLFSPTSLFFPFYEDAYSQKNKQNVLHSSRKRQNYYMKALFSSSSLAWEAFYNEEWKFLSENFSQWITHVNAQPTSSWSSFASSNSSNEAYITKDHRHWRMHYRLLYPQTALPPSFPAPSFTLKATYDFLKQLLFLPCTFPSSRLAPEISSAPSMVKTQAKGASGRVSTATTLPFTLNQPSTSLASSTDPLSTTETTMLRSSLASPSQPPSTSSSLHDTMTITLERAITLLSTTLPVSSWPSAPSFPLLACTAPSPFSTVLYTHLRAINGILEGEVDSSTGEFLPVYGNFDFLNALSLQKGCYTGQELMSRILSILQIRRRLFLVVPKRMASTYLPHILQEAKMAATSATNKPEYFLVGITPPTNANLVKNASSATSEAAPSSIIKLGVLLTSAGGVGMCSIRAWSVVTTLKTQEECLALAELLSKMDIFLIEKSLYSTITLDDFYNSKLRNKTILSVQLLSPPYFYA